jgi:ATP-binding cassette subfamily B protein
METDSPHVSLGTVLRFYARYAKRYTPIVLASILGAFVVAVLELMVPLFFARFIDIVSAGVSDGAITDATQTLIAAAAITLTAWAVRRVAQMGEIVQAARIMRDVEQDAFAYTLRHSYGFFAGTFSGSLVKKIGRLTRAYDELFSALVYTLIPLVTSVVGVLVVLWVRNTTLGIAMAVWIVVYLSINIVFALWLRPRNEMRAAVDTEVGGKLADAISNSVTISSYAAMEYEESRFAESLGRLKGLRFFIWTANEVMAAVQGLLVAVAQFGLLYVTFGVWQRGEVSVGDFTLVQTYVLLLMRELWGVARFIRSMFDSIADATEGVALVTRPHDVVDVPDAQSLVVSHGSVSFSDVRFAFERRLPVFENLNLSIAPGEKVALVGTSGAGKTTVTKLLARFYDVDAGSITIDGQDIARVTQESLRTHIALVPQDPILFHRTLMDNIRYGNLAASDELVFEAARKAHCHEFIERLPLGYQTLVGERGIRLSGGERQRVAIARAILKNAPILVLDEATSALDSESEHLIQDALHTLMQNKTVLVIAHRLSTIMQMDRILVMENGSIIDQGTHQELIARDGVYQKLWTIQAGGFLSE